MTTETTLAVSEPKFTFPPAEGELVAREYAHAGKILEYGSGGSTVLAARSTNAHVLSVESDKKWVENLNSFLKDSGHAREKVRVHWANIGPTAKWGYPADQSRWRRYPSYAFCPWEEFKFSPDVVLIDGRFRLACFAATMMLTKKPTTVLFDDYSTRDAYRAVESFVKPVQIIGRMAKFEIKPNKGNGVDFAELVRWFFMLK